MRNEAVTFLCLALSSLETLAFWFMSTDFAEKWKQLTAKRKDNQINVAVLVRERRKDVGLSLSLLSSPLPLRKTVRLFFLSDCWIINCILFYDDFNRIRREREMEQGEIVLLLQC